MKNLTLKGSHPYLGYDVSLGVVALGALPGPRITDRHNSRQADREAAWVALAGPYLLERNLMDADHLLSLVWDLMGLPMTDGGKPRPAAKFVLLEEGTGLVVYRAASEMIAEVSRMDEFAATAGSLNVAHVRRLARRTA